MIAILKSHLAEKTIFWAKSFRFLDLDFGLSPCICPFCSLHLSVRTNLSLFMAVLLNLSKFLFIRLCHFVQILRFSFFFKFLIDGVCVEMTDLESDLIKKCFGASSVDVLCITQWRVRSYIKIIK